MKNYDNSKESSYIMYLDANNLYGWAMSQKLPTHGYRFLNESEIDNFDINKIDLEDETGYMIECDLHYPKELHNKHNYYALAPESMQINPKMLSNYQKNLLDELKINNPKVNKLFPNLMDKNKYVCHARNLKFYLDQGLILKKIHRIISFKQSNWLAKYIDFNTIKRTESQTDADKDFYKLMNNSVFGKTCENVRNRCNVELVCSEKRLKRLVGSHLFKEANEINKNMIVEFQNIKKMLF